MKEKPLYKTILPLFKLRGFIIPIVIFLFCLRFNFGENEMLFAAVLFIIALTRLGYSEYNLFPEKIIIYRKNLFLPFKRKEFELSLNRLKEIHFTKGKFDFLIYFGDMIAKFLKLSHGSASAKASIDHIVTITYADEFTTGTLTETFNFDHRYTELEEIIGKTKPVK
ncbi:MAG TPA: hypothetical protein VF411_04925 [Bacteroidia bacterium]